MSLDLVVAYETASSPELRAALVRRAAADPDAAFVLLVPTTARRYLLIARSGRARDIALSMAASAKAQLEQAGLSVVKAVAGRAQPIDAIADELETNPDYSSIIICTHPRDISRWLKAEVPAKAQRFGLPVTHIVVRSVAEAAGYETRPPQLPWMPG